NLGETGCVNWMFNEKGQLTILKEDLKFDEDELMLLALEAGAEDLQQDEESFIVYTSPEDMEAVRQALLDQGIELEEAMINQVPQNTIEIADLDQAKKLVRMMELLEDHDDSQGVYANFEFADSINEEELD
ncbi:MAG TPA: YebC/PmpR family DNA-binding transcriptional regulator, partial [Desulfitobacterium dehalogenans]|nr:YebC/PmpR family DNA-binding transcriptional regulator [Desulfitobacterium dehalogenans]